MSVLVEGYSVIIQAQEIEAKWPGGWKQFEKDVPNKTLCLDGRLVRVGFMVYADAINYSKSLEENNIMEASNEEAQGYVFVSQLEGPKTKPGWLEIDYLEKAANPSAKVLVCRLAGDTESGLSAPIGWKYEGSLSDKPNFIGAEEAEQRLERIRKSDGLEVYYDKKRRKQVFVGRTGDDKKINDLNFEDEEHFSKADYEAVKKIAIRNGGKITNDEIFSVTVMGYMKLGKIKDQLVAEGVIAPDETEEE